MKRFILALALFALLIPASLGLAQDNPDVSVKLNGVAFNGSQILIDATFSNKTNQYQDNLMYVIELYKGDRLSDSGPRFSTTQFMIAGTGDIDDLAPNEVITRNLEYTPPKTLESGNYFIRLLANDKQLSFQSVDYTKEPIALQGNGDFLSPIKAYFRTNHGDDMLMAGWASEVGEDTAIVIPLSENQELSQRISSGELLYAEAKVLAVDSSGETVLGYPEQRLFASGGNVIFELPYDDVLKKNGTHLVILNILNEEGESLREIFARWVVEVDFVRIQQIAVEKNVYKRGETLNMNVTLASSYSNRTSVEGVVNINFFDEENMVYSTSQNISLSAKSVEISEKLNPGFRASSVEVSVEKLSGEILDSSSLKLKDFEIPGGERINFVWWFVIIIVLVLVVLWLILKNRKTGVTNSTPSVPMALLVLSIVSGLFLFSGSQVLAAPTTLPPGVNLGYNLSADQNTLTITSTDMSGSIMNDAYCPDLGNTDIYIADPYELDHGSATIGSLSWNIPTGDFVQVNPGSTEVACAGDEGFQGTYSLNKSFNVSSLSNGTYTLTLTVCSTSTGSYCTSDTASVVINRTTPTVPSITLSANPSSIDYNTSTTLSWTTSNATTCTAGGGWSGAITPNVSGSQTTSNLTANTTYSISCTNSAGSNAKSVLVTVGTAPTPEPPTVSITSSPANPIPFNSSATVSWTSSNASSCTLTNSAGGSQAVAPNTAGSTPTPNLTSNRTYTITCNNAGGGSSDSVTIFLGFDIESCDYVNPPILTFGASPTSVTTGGSSTLTWSLSGGTASSCTASGNWSGSKNTSGGSESTGPLSINQSYTLSCTNACDTDTDTKTASVSVVAPNAPTVTITSSPANPIPYNSPATLTWDVSGNATSCVASGSWSGSKASSNGSHTETTGNLTSGPKTYTITCSNAGGSSSSSVTVTVQDDTAPPTPAPLVYLYSAPSNPVGSSAVALTWTVGNNATSCTAYSTNGTWTGSKANSNGSHQEGIGSLSSNETFTITCSNASGSASASASVVVSQGGNGPSVDVSANPNPVLLGNGTTISWTVSGDATSCFAFGTNWSGPKASSNGTYTETISKFTVVGTYEFGVSCSNSGGTGSDSVLVYVVEEAPTVTITSSPANPIPYDSQATLTWTVSGYASECTASGAWEGDRNHTTGSHTETTDNLTESTYTYNIECSNIVGSSSDSVTVKVDDRPACFYDGTPSDIDIQIWFEYPEKPTCGTSITTDAYVRVTCSDDMNCMEHEFSVFGETYPVVEASGYSITHGPYSKTEIINSTLTYSATDTITEDSCHCQGVAGESNTVSETITCNPASSCTVAPTIDINAVPSLVDYGEYTTVSWSLPDDPADYCQAAGNWGGSKSVSGGSENLGPLHSDKTYSLTCTNTCGSTTEEVSVDVDSSTQVTVSLTATPNIVNSGGESQLTWNSSNANSCTGFGDWGGSLGVNGSQSTGSLTEDANYLITCVNTGSGQSANNSVFVLVDEGPSSPQPEEDELTVVFDASPSVVASGEFTTLYWTSTGAQKCQSSAGNWSVGFEKGTSGSESTGPLFANATYEITCTDGDTYSAPDNVVTDTASVAITTEDFNLFKSGNISVDLDDAVDGVATSTSATITVGPLNGFNDIVELSATSPINDKLSYDFSRDSLNLGQYNSGSILEIGVSASTPKGTYPVIIQGDGSGLIREIQILLNVDISGIIIEEI
jgi:hypothetical protein